MGVAGVSNGEAEFEMALEDMMAIYAATLALCTGEC